MALLGCLFEAKDSLEAARTGLVDRIYEAIPQVSQELRPVLLRMKRDAFNGRELARYSVAPQGQQIREVLGAPLDEVLDLEQRFRSGQEDLAAAYLAQRQTELHAVERLIADPRFLRGVALASPALANAMERWLTKPEDWPGRKIEKLQQSVLRYASRAALKLSPYSTLTPVALGAVLADREGPCLWLSPEGWQEHSLVRLRRHFTEQIRDVLLERPSGFAQLQVALGSELQKVSPGRYRLLRSGHWKKGETGGLTYQHDALVHVGASGSFYEWLEETVGDATISIGNLRERYGSSFPEVASDFDDVLARMVAIGFLRCLLPWRADDPSPERKLLAFLMAESDSATPHLRELRQILQHIVDIQDEFPHSLHPDRDVEEINRRVDCQLPEVLGISGPESPRSMKAQFNEDIFLTPRVPSSDTRWHIAGLAQSKAKEIVENLTPWVQVTNVFHLRYDFLLALAHQMKKTLPGRDRIPLLDLFSGVGGLWKEFSAFSAATRKSTGVATFDPFQDEAVGRLHALRLKVWEGIQGCWTEVGGCLSVDRDRVRALLPLIPPELRSPVGGGFFLQPADPAAELWVINQSGEGTGRFSSRFTSAMPGDLGAAFAGFFASTFSPLRHLGEEADLVDLVCPNGDNLNVHLAQTQRAIGMRSEGLDEKATGRLRLRDLWVELPPDGALPQLRDSSGRLILPVHLGLTNLRLMPVPVKFVAQFGPCESHLLVPPRPGRRSGSATVQDRMVLGNVVLRRKRWYFPVEDLKSHLDGAEGLEAFVRMNRWRMKNGIPDKVFLKEQRPFEFLNQEIFKPQFVDFSSPQFVEVILEGLAHRRATSMAVEEVLPLPESALPDGAGKHWAVEIQLDTLTLRKIVEDLDCAEDAWCWWSESPTGSHDRHVDQKGDENERAVQERRTGDRSLVR